MSEDNEKSTVDRFGDYVEFVSEEPLYTERQIIDRIMACEGLSVCHKYEIQEKVFGADSYVPHIKYKGLTTDEVIAALEK